MFIKTKHFIKRTAQRGISEEILDLFLRIYDISYSSHGSQCLKVSRKYMNLLLKDSKIPKHEKSLIRKHIYRLERLKIVVSDGVLISAVILNDLK